MKKTLERLMSGTTRLFVLALGLGLTATGWAVDKANPVTGATESYAYSYVGTGTSDTWTADDWADSNSQHPSKVPQDPSDGDWSSLLIDGDKTVSAEVEGWAFNIGLFGGAKLTVSTLHKWAGNCSVKVDASSKLTITALGSKAYSDTIDFYVAAQNGITYGCDYGKGGTFNYYFAGNGSVSYQNLTGGNHTIKQADVTLSGGTKLLQHKTLVSFSNQPTFDVNAIVVLKNSNGDKVGESVLLSCNNTGTPTISEDGSVGTCEFVRTATGLDLYWVDGDPSAVCVTPSININFTHSSVNVSGYSEVGALGYSVSGYYWNNIAGQVGTTSTVYQKNAKGAKEVASGVTVAISDTRGSWSSSGGNILHGYIDDTQGGSQSPTVVVSGIPSDFGNYRVVMYFSNGDNGTKFGYVTVNSKNYWGTDSWGSANYSAFTENGNFRVTPIISRGDGTLTIITHCPSGSRSGLAAIQIVKVDADYLLTVEGETASWSTTPPSSGADAVINVVGDSTLTVSDDISFNKLSITGTGTLTLTGTAKYTASTLDINQNITLNVNADRLDATTFTGSGTVVYDTTAPVEGKGWANIGWSGTVWIKNQSVSSFEGTKFGNAGSTVRFTGVTGFLQTSSWNSSTYVHTVPLELVDDGDTVAFTYNNGWGGNLVKINTLKGTGTLKTQGSGLGEHIYIVDGSGFTGVFNLTGKYVYVGGSQPDYSASTNPNGKLEIRSGVTMTVPTGKTWTANGGFVVNGTLNAVGSLSSTGSPAVSGSGTVVFNNKTPAPTGNAWWPNASWTGTVEIRNTTLPNNWELQNYGNQGSKVCLDGVQSPLKYGSANHNIGELIIAAGGYTHTGSYSSGTVSFTIPCKVTGSGTYKMQSGGGASKTTYFTGDISEFSGVLAFGDDHSRYVIGSTETPFTAKSIVVGNGAVAKICYPKEWYPAGGVVVDEGGVLDVASSSGYIDTSAGIVVNGTVKAKSPSQIWGGIGPNTPITVNSTGVLELTGLENQNDTATDFSKVSGTGTVLYKGAGWRALPYDTNGFADTLAVDNQQPDGLLLLTAGATYTIGSLSGDCGFRADNGWGSAARTLCIKQAKDTTWSGTIRSDNGSSTGGSRLGTVQVDPGANNTSGTLTLSGENSTTVALNISANAKVNLTGTWKGATTVFGTFGGSGTLDGALTLNNGSTFKPNGLNVSTATMAAGSTLDLSAHTGSGAAVAGTLTLDDETTLAFPANATFPYHLATAVSGVTELESTQYTIGGTTGTSPLKISGGKAYPDASTTISSGGTVNWTALTWTGASYAGQSNLGSANCTITVTENATLNLGTGGAGAPSGKMTITVSEGKTLTLNGQLVASEISISGNVVCDSAYSLNGTITGTGTVQYPNHVLPLAKTANGMGASWTDSNWRGTLILPNCGHLKDTTYPNTSTGVVLFDQYGSANSKIDARGFQGCAATTDASEHICAAELVVADGQTVEFNHGDSAMVSGDSDTGFIFAKLSGSGTLRLDGSSDTVQYVFRNVDSFSGSVTITDPTPDDFTGGKKSFIFGAGASWSMMSADFPAYLVIATSMTVAANKAWDVPAGIVIMDGATLTLSNGSSVSRIGKSSSGTLQVAANATASVVEIKDGVISTKLDILSGAKLNVCDTNNVASLTIPGDVTATTGTLSNLGTLDLSGTAITELHYNLGKSKSLSFGTVTPPASLQFTYYDLGEDIRNLDGYTVPGANCFYYATETIAEYAAREAANAITFTNVPDEIEKIIVYRKSGAVVNATVPDGGPATTRRYFAGSQFAGAACWHEWDFEQAEDVNKLNDTGRFSVNAEDASLLISLAAANPSYSEISVPVTSESKTVINTASKAYPSGGSLTFPTDAWSAAVRCSMPADDQVAVAFGNTTTGVLGLKSVGTDSVQLFNWMPTDGGTSTVLAQLKVESATSAQHIYVFAVTNDTTASKHYVEFYRDGEFIHKAEFALASGITTFAVGTVAGTHEGKTHLPVDATSGATDYVRLYDKVLETSNIEGLSARRPFVSATETYERTLSFGGYWNAVGSWTKKSDGTSSDVPAADCHVTANVSGMGGVSVNLDADAHYNTLIFSGNGPVQLSRYAEKPGKISADMAVVRKGVTLFAQYDAVDFENTPVGVDQGASLIFDFTTFPFENVTAATSFYVTGPVVAYTYDQSVASRITANATIPHTWSISGQMDTTDAPRYKVTITPDHNAGDDVYYNTGILDDDTAFYHEGTFEHQTTMFTGDKVVISSTSDLTGDTVTVAPSFAGNIKVTRTTLNIEPEGDATVLEGCTVEVSDGCTLHLAGGNYGALTLNCTGTGSVVFDDDATVASISGSAAITVATGKTLTLTTTSASFTGTINATGDSNGVVKFAGDVADIDLDKYGSANSVVALGDADGATVGIASGAESVATTLRLDGNVTVTLLDSAAYSFAKLTGTGNLAFPAPSAGSPTSITIGEIAGYTGTVVNNNSVGVTVTKLTLAEDVAGGTKILSKSGTVTVTGVYVGDSPVAMGLVYTNDGVYKAAAAKVASTTTYFASLQEAVDAADAVSYIEVLADGLAEIASVTPVKVKPNSNSFTVTCTAAGYGAWVQGASAGEEGVYNYAPAPQAATFVWGGASSDSWGTASSWTSTDGTVAAAPNNAVHAVSFPNAATVTVDGNYAVASMTVEGVVSFSKTGDSAVTITSAGAIVIANASASIAVTGVTLSPTPTTSVEGYYVTVTESEGTTTYAVAQGASVTIGAATFDYLANYSGARTVTATVTGEVPSGTTWTLNIGGTEYPGEYIATGAAVGTVTFNNVAALTLLSTVNYTITAGGTASGTYNGNTTVGNVTDGWIVEPTSGTATGSWFESDGTTAATVTYTEGKAPVQDKIYKATTESIGEIVTITTRACFGDAADSGLTVSSDAQAAVRIGETSTQGVYTFEVLTDAANQTWLPVAADGLVVNPSTEYAVTVVLNYTSRKYSVSVAAGESSWALANGETSLFNMAASGTNGARSIQFMGSGTLASIVGSYVGSAYVETVEGESIVVDQQFVNEYLGTLAAAEAQAKLSPSSNEKAANGINNYFECYALGLDPTEEDDKVIVDVTTDDSGKFVFTVKHPTFDGDGNITGYKQVTEAANVTTTVTLKYGTSTGELNETTDATKIAPADMDFSTGNVLYYKAEVTIGAK